MAKVVGVCPNCGKDIVVDNTKQIDKCNLCNSSYYIYDALNKDNKNSSSNKKQNYYSNNNNYSQNVTTKKKSGHPVFWTLFVILCIIVAGIYIIKDQIGSNTNDNIIQTVTERDITNSDLEMSSNQGISSVTVFVVAKNNIKWLEIEFVGYNKNDKIIYSNTQTKRNLVKNNTYSYEFPLSLEVMLQIEHYKCCPKGAVSLI